MRTVVAVPWAGDCHHREAALAWVLTRWVGYRVSVGVINPPWCKAAAVKRALTGTDAEIVVVADADVWSPGVDQAVNAVRDGASWAIPHGLVYRLSQASTAAVLAGVEPYPGMALDPDEPTAKHNRGYQGRPGGGIVALRRDIYEDCPLDPRFIGWGHEDEAWALALTCLHGPPVRFDHPLFHLWHPPQPRLSRGCGSGESERLYLQYAKARRSPDLMREVLKGVAE